MALQPWVHVETFEEYKERFKDFAYMERTDDGILLVRLHWKGGPVVWSYQTQHAYGHLWTAIGHDKQNEVLILTCQNPYWLCQSSDPSSFDEVEDSPGPDLKYDCNVPDTMNFVENFINDIEIPTIAAINGIGQHYEFALMSDITLTVPEFFFSDAHFSHSIVPGDGMNFAYRVAVGPKRAAYMAYMEPKIDAKGRAYATGKRKDAVARVWIKPGPGTVTVNGRDGSVYFARPVLRMIVSQPFGIVERVDQYDVVATVVGGGLSGQAGAVRHGISKALTYYEPALRGPLKAAGECESHSFGAAAGQGG